MDIEKMAEIFEAVKVISLRPNDVLVFRCEKFLNRQQTEDITQYLRHKLPDIRVLIVDGGTDLDVIRKEGAIVCPAP